MLVQVGFDEICVQINQQTQVETNLGGFKATDALPLVQHNIRKSSRVWQGACVPKTKKSGCKVLCVVFVRS